MKILADENIALVHEAFGNFGELRTVPGRSINSTMLADADALLVRSVTQVNAQLLAETSCKFVGTATSGIDHVDLQWLQQQGIAFAAAPGCNANSVVDYVFSALAALSQRSGEDWRQLGVGIIGCGAVGNRLAKRLIALGMDVLIHDPLLPATHPLSTCFAPLETVLQQSIVTVHAPLETKSRFPTFHMLNQAALALLQPDAILINAARGEIIDSAALFDRITATPQLQVVLDAWEGEPEVSQSMLAKVAIGTPHIAGYSETGKIQGTALLQQAYCRHFNLVPTPDLFNLQQSTLMLPSLDETSQLSWLNQCLLSAYDIRSDHQQMQTLLGKPGAGVLFDALRKHYPLRHEYGQLEVGSAGEIPIVMQQQLAALGFRVKAVG